VTDEDRFTRDTAIEPLGPGRYRGRVDPGWSVVDDAAPNGGYLLAIIARAMRAEASHPDPVSLTGHFLRPPGAGDVTVEVEAVRRGRRHDTLAARLIQEDTECVRVLSTFGDLGAASGPSRVDLRSPPFPPRESCIDTSDQAAAPGGNGDIPDFPIQRRFDHRQPPDLAGWAVGAPAGRGEMGGYVRFSDAGDDDAMDTLGLLVVADCLAPAVFNLGDVTARWVPTIELTVQVRARPAPGYLAARFTTQAITNGYLEEDGQIWDAEGSLVALSRQLALMPR